MTPRVWAWLLVGLGVTAAGAQTQRPGQLPSRDTPAQKQDAPAPQGRITGRVLVADSGRPLKRARVMLTAPELPDGRGAQTDDQGVFDFTELPAGRYTLTASKTGFLTLSYGQRRPLQAGTPLQLGDGQQMRGLEFRLPRGSAVGGRVLDEDGDPMPGVTVLVERYQYLQGDRRLVPAGSAQTDDKGQYRVWGLMPGDYYVAAVVRNFGAFGGRGGFGGGFGGFPGGFGGRGASGPPAATDDEPIAYVPTYFPGVTSVNEARAVGLGIGQEVLEVDFNLQLVRASRISGTVTNPDGSPVTSGTINLMADGVGTAPGRGPIGVRLGSRIDWDGSFQILNIPPGRYTLRARGDDREIPQFAAQPITVAGDLSGLIVILAPSARITGTVSFDGGQPPDLNQVRIVAPATDQAAFGGPNPNGRVDKEGQFTLEDVPAGAHWIRANGPLRGWSLKSVTVDGREMVDTPIELRSGQTLANVRVTFTNRLTEINGTVVNDQNVPMSELTVLAFPTDPTLWRPQARQIMTARPDQNGQYRIRGLPAGDYYLAVIDPGVQGEWFEPTFLEQHRLDATRVSLVDGDTKTKDFKVKS